MVLPSLLLTGLFKTWLPPTHLPAASHPSGQQSQTDLYGRNFHLKPQDYLLWPTRQPSPVSDCPRQQREQEDHRGHPIPCSSLSKGPSLPWAVLCSSILTETGPGSSLLERDTHHISSETKQRSGPFLRFDLPTGVSFLELQQPSAVLTAF